MGKGLLIGLAIGFLAGWGLFDVARPDRMSSHRSAPHEGAPYEGAPSPRSEHASADPEDQARSSLQGEKSDSPAAPAQEALTLPELETRLDKARQEGSG